MKNREKKLEQYIREKSGWVGVDLDATLADYDEWIDEFSIGEPIPEMVRKVKALLKLGIEVRIFTARASDPQAIPFVEKWCEKHLGQVLKVSNVKDHKCIEIWDDRAIQVQPNTGELVGVSRLKDLFNEQSKNSKTVKVNSINKQKNSTG